MSKTMKKILAAVLCMALAFGFMPNQKVINTEASQTIALGADIGWLSQLESQGVKWLNKNGVQEDCLKILKDNGVDSVRLRVFVNPPSNFIWVNDDGYSCMLGYTDVTGVLSMAQRANAMGMKIMIDFHYSDHFADPKYQDLPSAWEGATVAQLKQYVYDHTYYVMSELAKLGIYPEWVQVGNEIGGGILHPYGESGSNFAQLAQFLNSGYDAVKAVSKSTKVVTHLAGGENKEVFDWFFNAFLNTYNGKTDVIGMSYYPYWIGSDYTQSIAALETNMNYLAGKYGKEIMICETGGHQNNENNTYQMLKAVINAVKNVNNGKGAGVFYWEPEANSSVLTDGYMLGATTVVSGKTLKFNKALDAFLEQGSQSLVDSGSTYKIVNRNSGKALNVAGGSQTAGALIEQYSYGGWSSQKWNFVEVESGYYKIVNALTGMVIDVNGKSTADGASCIQWAYSGGFNQQWSLEENSNGYIVIRNRLSGKVLDINAKSTADGGLCVQWTYGGGTNQQWTIEKVN